MFISNVSRQDVFKKLSEVFIIIAAFALPTSTALLEISACFSVVCWCLYCVFSRYRDWTLHPVAWAYLMLFTLFVLGMSYTDAPLAVAVHTLLKYSKFLIGVFFFKILAEQRVAQAACVAFLGAVLLTLALSYFKFFTGIDFIHHDLNDSSVFKDHIFTGFLFAFASYYFALLACFLKRWRWLFLILCACTIYNVLFINLGRSAYLVLVALTILLGWQMFRWKGFLIACIVLGALLSGAFLYSNNFKERLSEGWHNIQAYDQGQTQTSLGLRLDFYQASFKLIQSHPFFGYGTGSFAQHYATLMDHGGANNPHNEYLNIAVQFGLFGLALLCLLFYIHWQQSQHLEIPRRFFAQSILVAIVAGSTVNSWLMDVTQGYFYVLLTALVFSGAGSCAKIKMTSSHAKQCIAQ